MIISKHSKFENFDYRNVVGAYMNNLGRLSRSDVVDIGIVMLQVH